MWFWNGLEEGETTYKITVKTSGVYAGAGTDATVSINLYDQDGDECTGFFGIDNFFYNDFEKGREDHFEVNKKDVGIPAYIRIKLKGGEEDEWFCEYINVSLKSDESRIASFPVYDWVSDEMGVAEGTATLPQNVLSKSIRSMRAAEVNKNTAKFEWIPTPLQSDIGWGLPRYVNASTPEELPKIFQRSTVRQSTLNSNKLLGGLKFIASLATKIFDEIKEFTDYHSLNFHAPTERNIRNFLENWETDEVMGRQVLTGINPLLFKKCTRIPAEFSVTNNDVSSFLRAGKTLEEEIAAGKIYLVNYKEVLEDVSLNSHAKTKEAYYCPTSFGLFYSNPEGKFLPIAIQLVPGDRDYLFTPADSKDDWMLAKMYFRSADLSHHEWISHFLLTHNIVEPFAVSLFRSFPKCHPLFKLLKPHLRSVSIINVEARTSLVPPDSLAGGVIAYLAGETAKSAYRTFCFEDIVLPKRLKKQGTDDPKLLPNFFYRDDAMILWDIIENYVSGVIRHYYKNNHDIREDFELQFWAKDCAKEGLGWHDGNTRGMPESIATIESLIEICTAVIFTSSVQHAAVNFGQMDTYKFAPNVPSAMRLPPHKKGEANKQRILESLPDAYMAGATITISQTLSSFSPNEIYIGQFPEKLFIEEAVLNLQRKFKNELEKAENIIKERNSKIKVPYTWLLPSRVPNSIAI